MRRLGNGARTTWRRITTRRRRFLRLLGGAAGTLAVAAALGIVPGGPLGAGIASAAASFSKTETISRTNLNPDGSETVVDSRTFSVDVDQTQDLRGRQQINVSWTGAHPTGGIVTDPNSQGARNEEYPVVLLECRGMDTPSAPAGQQLTPSTCWTESPFERYEASYATEFPEWRLDRYATADQRAQFVNKPPASANCDDGALAQYYQPFVAVDGTSYAANTTGQCTMPPEMELFEDPAAPPANTVYGVTGPGGSGTEPFEIWTDQENSSLGCSNTVPCALVIVPIMGISCDPAATQMPIADRPPVDDQAADAALCEKTGRYAPGEQLTNAKQGGDLTVTGALWWAASNWRNRITVPLTFAPPANVCDSLDSRIPVDIYGSEIFDQAGLLWQQKFCTDPTLFKFQHVSTGEPQAKSALANGSINAALASRPPDTPFTTPTVSAPIAVTGFAISYAIDGADGNPYTSLKLNARLLAKLLSESYWGYGPLLTDYKALPSSNRYSKMAGNPEDLSVDPEFTALNPGIPAAALSQTASTLLALSGNSDVMYALTSYINADPDARTFLNGTPDPWGMTVNPAYKNIKLPLSAWPLEDDFLSPDIALDGCLLDDQGVLVPAVPVLPLIAAPMASLEAIAQAMQFAVANSQTSCSPILNQGGELVGGTLKALGRQPPGFRFMLGLTAVGDANLYGLRDAALQSSSGHFVTPTNAGMIAAVKTATEDRSTGTWNFSYSKLRSTAAAYPGTMIVYAEVPTKGLDATVAGELAQFVRYAASSGQKAGEDIGQLPPGYVPMTSGNGMSALVAEANQDADLIAAQTGRTSGSVSSSGPAGSTGSQGSGTSNTHPSPGEPSSHGPVPSESPTPGYTPPVKLPLGYTPVVKSDSAAWMLPSAVIASLIAMLIAIVLRTATSMRRSSDLHRRARRINGGPR